MNITKNASDWSGSAFAAYLKHMGITRYKASKITGLPLSEVYYLAKENSNPQSATLDRLAGGFGLSARVFLLRLSKYRTNGGKKNEKPTFRKPRN